MLSQMRLLFVLKVEEFIFQMQDSSRTKDQFKTTYVTPP